MGDQKHIINKQVLEVKLSSNKEAHLIQDAFSKAFKTHIIPAFERVVDRLTRNGEIIKIDKLEVDVGGISIDNLHNDFSQRFERNLEELLIEKIHTRKLEIENISTPSESSNFSKGYIEALSIKSDIENSEEILNYFLLSGTLPWWSSKNIQDIAEELIEKSPGRVKTLLLKLLRNQTVRKRFINQISEKTTAKFLFILTPNTASFLLEIVKMLTAVQSIHPFINHSQNKFKEEIWNSILACLVENSTSINSDKQNDVELMHLILSRLIVKTFNNNIYQKELYQFISKISDCIILSKEKIQGLSKLDSTIKTLLSKLREAEISEDLMADSVIHSKLDNKIHIELFTYFLNTGKIPFNNGNYNDSDIQLMAEELLENSPENMRVLLLNLFTHIDVRKRFIHHFSDDLIYKTLRTIIPSSASSIVKLIEAILKIQLLKPFNNIPNLRFREEIWNSTLIYIANNPYSFNIDKSKGVESISQNLIKHIIRIGNGEISLKEILENIELPTKPKLMEEDIQKTIESKSIIDKNNQMEHENEIAISKSRINKTAASITEKDGSENSNLQQSIKMMESYKTIHAFDKSPQTSPEIQSKHITNAGLAILWPFLNIFFVRLNIVKDKQFVSNEAAHRAVHLIQYLVTEKEETPEYELLFNKLLCGVDIYEPIPLGIKLTEIEKEECDALLQSAIDNWTALKNTSINTLRTTFLQKEGILSKQSNGWKLAVERTTVDVLIDRLPWSISMITLPWSNEMIYVEW